MPPRSRKAGAAEADAAESPAEKKPRLQEGDAELEAEKPPAVEGKEGEASPVEGEKKEKKAKKEKKDKKDKKEKKEKKEKKDSEPEVASDTEYGECDLSKCPAQLVIRGSGHPRVDGCYKRLEEPSRGRPCYGLAMVRQGSKNVYIFWHKNNKWHVSYELGGMKSLARVEGVRIEGWRMPPCEPHPFAWKVRPNEAKKDKSEKKDKASKSHVLALTMRVIDGATLDSQSFVAEPVKSRNRRSLGERKAADVDAAASSAAAAGDVDEEAAAAEAAAGAESESDEEDAGHASAESSSEESDSSDSSESSASEEAPAKPPPAPAKEPPNAAATGAAAGKREPFIRKLRTQLEQIREPKQRQVKLQQVRAMLTDRAEHVQKHAGMTGDEIRTLMDTLDRDFGPQAKAKPVAPARPTAAPSTPPAAVQNVRKSSLKRKDGSRRPGRISWPSHNIHLVSVTSFRHMGEQLWFQMPGAYVICDGCDKSVPQSMGALQGEPHRPQFAQCQYLCSDCLQTQSLGHPMSARFPM